MGITSDQIFRAISTLLGWIYVYCWSASFYPQPILNWKRKSTKGLTVDFPALNVLGFVSYTISTSCFLFSPTIRAQYAERHPRAPEPTVRFNDFAFAAHAMVLVILTYSQFYTFFWPFEVPKGQRTSKFTRVVILGSIVMVLLGVCAVALQTDVGSSFMWIDVIYMFGFIKLLATFLKYIPQAWLNYQRGSTEGWSIDQILFDFVGGITSLMQLVIDASFQADWSGVTGNPAKFGLSNISLFFDVIFIVQHYVLYRNAKRDLEDRDEQTRLIAESSRA